MSEEFEDPRKELLEDLKQWLEWQAVCGGEVWPVEDISVWTQRLPKIQKTRSASTALPGFLQRSSKPEPKKSTSVSPSGFLQKRKPVHDSPLDTVPKKQKGKRQMGAAFTQFLQKRAPTIDHSKLDEQTGLKTIKEHQREHCSSAQKCAIGGGRPRNPVLVIEGHKSGLTPAAKESLGKIMDNVLNIPRNKMYWLPYPIQQQQTAGDCNLCPHLFKASLECLAPQIVLILGGELEQKIAMRAPKGPLQMGLEIEMQTNKWKLPALWTHHPADMIGNTQLKRECMTHLKEFKRMLRKVSL